MSIVHTLLMLITADVHRPDSRTSSVSDPGAYNPPYYGWEINPHVWHGEAQFTSIWSNTEAQSYSLALRDLDTLMNIFYSPLMVQKT